MLKISIAETSTERRLVLQGRMVGGSVAELRGMCDLLRSELNGRPLIIDLQHVTMLSQEGEIVLFHLMGEGARLFPNGVVAKYVLQQFSRRKQGSDVRKGSSSAMKERMCMGILQNNLTCLSRMGEYATPDDFGALFDKELTSLYLLSYALTGDHIKGEQCLLAALDDCLNGAPVFRHSVRSRVRASIIGNANQTVRPSAANTHLTGSGSDCRLGATSSDFHKGDPMAILFRLPDFQRFVFVMSVLEQYQDQDCAAALGCTELQVRDARIEAFQAMARSHFALSPSKSGGLGPLLEDNSSAV